jgi:hypothetical protein
VTSREALCACCNPASERIENSPGETALEARHVLYLPRGRPVEYGGQAVEFGVEIEEYRGVVRVPRRVF